MNRSADTNIVYYSGQSSSIEKRTYFFCKQSVNSNSHGNTPVIFAQYKRFREDKSMNKKWREAGFKRFKPFKEASNKQKISLSALTGSVAPLIQRWFLPARDRTTENKIHFTG